MSDRDGFEDMLPPNAHRECRLHQVKACQLVQSFLKRIQPRLQERCQETSYL